MIDRIIIKIILNASILHINMCNMLNCHSPHFSLLVQYTIHFVNLWLAIKYRGMVGTFRQSEIIYSPYQRKVKGLFHNSERMILGLVPRN